MALATVLTFVASCGPAPEPPPPSQAPSPAVSQPSSDRGAAPAVATPPEPAKAVPAPRPPPATSRPDTPAPPPAAQAKASSAALGRNFDIRIGEGVEIAGSSLTVTFERVIEDSRCPTNTTCFWAGVGVVRLGLRGVNAERGTLELHTDAGPQQEASFQTYRVRLVQLAPYPKDSTGISAEKYVATLIVVKRTP